MYDVFRFGERLLETNDLDPVYVMLWGAQLPDPVLKRWLLAYWCFYHVGTASWIADTPVGYWDRFVTAAGSKEFPRCHERRHFRGEKAVKATQWLSTQGVAELFDLILNGPHLLQDVMEVVQKWPQFGPWISFKMADMLERLDLLPVEFDAGAMFLFDSPKDGAELMAKVEGGPETDRQQWAVDTLIQHFRSNKAPPRYERSINCQEAETILCKWKSYRGGHYEIGEDVKGLRKSLSMPFMGNLSKRLLKHCPKW